MKTNGRRLRTRLPAILLAACGASLTGCENTGESSGGAVHPAGYNDYPADWYATDVDRPGDGNRPPPRPTHPIALPPSRPMPTPMPMPRPALRR